MLCVILAYNHKYDNQRITVVRNGCQTLMLYWATTKPSFHSIFLNAEYLLRSDHGPFECNIINQNEDEIRDRRKIHHNDENIKLCFHARYIMLFPFFFKEEICSFLTYWLKFTYSYLQCSLVPQKMKLYMFVEIKLSFNFHER